MRPMQFAAGTVIFRAGEASTAVYLIEDGEVAIRVGNGVEVARLQAGELFGESGVLERRPRAASAIAITPTNVLVTEAAMFLAAFGLDNERALALVKLLCRRLRATNARAAQIEPAAICLIPDHPRLCGEFALAPMDVRQVPFQVGNRYGGETLLTTSSHSCCIPARAEANLSAPHFEILRRGGQLGVRDLFSRLGTIVNKTAVSRGSTDMFVPLRVGENEVIAGRRDSVFRFRLVVGPAPRNPPQTAQSPTG